jgi:hypothetical protein
MMLRLFVLLAGGAAAVWSFRRWRGAVQAALVLLIFEGAIRKWLVPGAQDLVYFAKDVLLLGAYLGFLRDLPRLRLRLPALPFFYVVLVLSVLFGLLEVFNPILPSLLLGALGFKSYFFYVPLMFVLPAVFPDDASLARAMYKYLLIAIPVGVLATAQFFSPASSPLNTYARTGEDAAAVVTFGSSSFVRVTGTFSFISGFTAYLLAMSILLLAWLAGTRWRFRGNLLILSALGLVLLAMLMTGSRGPLVSFVLILPIYWLLAIVRERQGGATFFRLFAGLALIALVVNQTGGAAVGAFRGRAASSGDDVAQRMIIPLEAPLRILPQAGLAGFGIGATHQAAMSLVQGVPFYWLRGIAVEVETGRVMVELGPVGFLLVYFLRLYLAVYAFQQVLRLKTPFHRTLATACMLFFLAAIPTNVVFDVTAGMYFWAFGGLLMTAVALDRKSPRPAVVRTRAAAPPARPAATALPIPESAR